MKTVTFQGRTVTIDGNPYHMPYEIREAFALGEIVIVLLDPNAYLKDPTYDKERRRGNNPQHNLLGLDGNGKVLWEAEFAEPVDYYYRVASRSPLVVLSFSSFRCEIDPHTGKIVQKEFFK